MARVAVAAAIAALALGASGGGASADPVASTGVLAFVRVTGTYEDSEEDDYYDIWSAASTEDVHGY